jgi:hypothetical protein
MKYVKEDLERYVLVDNLSYKEIGRIYGCSDTYIKRRAREFGIELPIRAIFPKDFEPSNKNKTTYIICKNCGKTYYRYGINKGNYCSITCSSEHKVELKYLDYIENQEKYCSDRDMKFVKKHILKDQNNKCGICNIYNFWNEKPLSFILDHIDGDASNNMRNNLRLVCSNCDSQLDTYKSKNKNSARKERYIKNYKKDL